MKTPGMELPMQLAVDVGQVVPMGEGRLGERRARQFLLKAFALI